MKFTKIATVLGMAAVCTPALAQYEGTRVYDRIGHGQDSITTLGNIVAYKDSYKAQDYAGAYEPWKAVLTKALRGSQHVCLWSHDFGQRISQRTGFDQEKGLLPRTDGHVRYAPEEP